MAGSTTNDYRKWVRYFLDFRDKYASLAEKSVQVKLFSEKLRSKGQTAQQILQAADAVSLFFASQKIQPAGRLPVLRLAAPDKVQHAAGGPRSHRQTATGTASATDAGMVCEIPRQAAASSSWRGRRFDDWRCLKRTEYPAWDAIVAALADEIKARHYSRKTLQH